MLYDYYGHGYSDGPRGDIKNFFLHVDHAQKFIRHLITDSPTKPFFLLGESMGGTVLLNTLITHSNLSTEFPNIRGIILFAPGIKIKTSNLPILDVLKGVVNALLYPLNPGRLCVSTIQKPNANIVKGEEIMNPLHFEYDRTNLMHLQYLSLRYLLQLNKGFSRAFKYGPDAIKVPVIIFYGTNDSAISQQGIETFYNRIPLPQKQLIIIEKTPHAMFTHQNFQPYWEVIKKWLAEQLGKL
jgi:alpha-beta hydrolase superfamily lysophospholipase